MGWVWPLLIGAVSAAGLVLAGLPRLGAAHPLGDAPARSACELRAALGLAAIFATLLVQRLLDLARADMVQGVDACDAVAQDLATRSACRRGGGGRARSRRDHRRARPRARRR